MTEQNNTPEPADIDQSQAPKASDITGSVNERDLLKPLPHRDVNFDDLQPEPFRPYGTPRYDLSVGYGELFKLTAIGTSPDFLQELASLTDVDLLRSKPASLDAMMRADGPDKDSPTAQDLELSVAGQQVTESLLGDEPIDRADLTMLARLRDGLEALPDYTTDGSDKRPRGDGESGLNDIS